MHLCQRPPHKEAFSKGAHACMLASSAAIAQRHRPAGRRRPPIAPRIVPQGDFNATALSLAMRNHDEASAEIIFRNGRKHGATTPGIDWVLAPPLRARPCAAASPPRAAAAAAFALRSPCGGERISGKGESCRG